jgi:hypothetical protein
MSLKSLKCILKRGLDASDQCARNYGGQFTVAVAATNTQQFFRLHSQ